MSEKDKEQSPNQLETPDDGGSKKVHNRIVLVLGILALVIVWSLNRSGTDEKNEPEVKRETVVETKALMPGEDAGRGLAGSGSEPVGMVQVEQKPNERSEMRFVGPQKDDDAEARRMLEEEERRKRQAYYAGLGANMIVQRPGSSGAAAPAGNEDGQPRREAADSKIPASPDYDPAADMDKEGFFQRADTTQWRSPFTREAGLPFELKTGTIVPGIMVTGVNSDLPGNIIAQVSQNVFDSATGKHLLVPQGSRIFGAYDSRVVYGQERVLVAWNRIIFPDGSAVTLGAMPGADMSGYAGFNDKVNNHYLRIFGSAFLMSMITGGMSYAVDSASNSTEDNTSRMQDEMASALAAQIGQTTMRLLEKNLNIKPTIEIRPGYRFNIIVTKDVIFRGAYAGWR
jgi:type IV secretion system protein VirB10